MELPEGLLRYIRTQARRLAYRLRNSGPHVDVDDLIQVAQIACWEAAARFDPARGNTALTFLWRRADGAMIDYLRSPCFGGRNGFRDVVIESLDRTLTPKGSLGQHAPLHPDVADPEADDAFELAERLIDLAPAFTQLDRRTRYVLSQYYFADRTLAAIGEDLGLTESRICQIHTKALRDIRLALAS